MKTSPPFKSVLVSVLVALGCLVTAHAAPSALTFEVGDDGVIRRNGKIVSPDEARALAQEQAKRDPRGGAVVTAAESGSDNAAKLAQALRDSGVSHVTIQEEIAVAQAGDGSSSTLKFSDASKPGTLKIVVTNGDIRVRGVEGATITVRTELKPERAKERKDGLRVLTSSATFSLSEKDNVATLSYGTDSWPNGGGDFDITVPRNSNIVVSSSFGGDIDIGAVTGDIEIKSLNGEVTLNDVSGGASVETMNGEIHANIRTLTDGKPLSFTSMNGEVQLKLARDAKASVRLRTHNGSILTDFDEKQLVTKTVSVKGARPSHGPQLENSNDAEEIRATVREAVRLGIDAAREAARGARDAMREARGQHDDNDDDHGDVTPRRPMAPGVPVPPMPPMTGGKIITGTLNGGGPEVRVTTMNGDVTLRKADGK